MPTPRRLRELEFPERAPGTLLNLSAALEPLDEDFSAVGHARFHAIDLEGTSPPSRFTVHDAWVLGLHAFEEGPPLPDDLELAFWQAPETPQTVDDPDETTEVVVVTLLSTFLRQRILPLYDEIARPRAPRAIVWALCNEHRARFGVPPGWPDVPTYYATGVVESWAQAGPSPRAPVFGLCAEAWYRLR